MHIAFYEGLDSDSIPGLDKFLQFLKNDDFRSADVKKVAHNLYRAKLDRSNRILFSIHRFQDQRFALILEYLPNHAYEKSKFLSRDVKVDENKIPAITSSDIDSAPEIPHLNPQAPFHFLDKIISFDDEQREVLHEALPLIIIGSAGSGKTAILLEKIKPLKGRILYITQSPYLCQHSESLLERHTGKKRNIRFFTFDDFIENIQIPRRKRCTRDDFLDWFELNRNATSLKNPHAVFEEFRGTLTSSLSDTPWLDKQEYLSLGIKQSLFAENEREAVYALFKKYLGFLKENNLYDLNLLSHQYLSVVSKRYDTVVIDEVQDFTLVQIRLILGSCRDSSRFILSGDANQIVHPNLFSWNHLKNLLFKVHTGNTFTRVTRILSNNYRNSDIVTGFANQLLKLKKHRFGSIDRESHYLMKSISPEKGKMQLFQLNDKACKIINEKMYRSANHAILVLSSADKEAVRRHFKTPLVFTIQECKGLEYQSIILFNMISGERKAFSNLVDNISADDLDSDFQYSRNKDKYDKSPELLKFYINALYVATTRATENLYILESSPDNAFLRAVVPQLVASSPERLDAASSSDEDWQEEARRLQAQGKTEQASSIRSSLLAMTPPDWTIYAGNNINELYQQAIDEGNKRSKLTLYEYALVYEDHRARNALMSIDFKPAFEPENGLKQLYQKHFMAYQLNKSDAVRQLIQKYGVDYRNPFNQTPLMIAAWLGKPDLIDLLQEEQASHFLANNKGHTPLQICIERACMHSDYAHQIFPALYEKLTPLHLIVRVGSTRYQYHNLQMEFFLIHSMIALFYRLLPEELFAGRFGFGSESLSHAIAHLESPLIADEFKDQETIQKLLNQYSRTDGKQRPLLFVQLDRETFMFNPELRLKIENEWLYIYDILWIEDISFGASLDQNQELMNEVFELVLSEKKELLQQKLQPLEYQ